MAIRDKQKEAEEEASHDDTEGENSSEEQVNASGEQGAGVDESNEEELEEGAAATMGTLGTARYVITGFFLAMIAATYVVGRSLGALWGYLAEAVWFQKSAAVLARVGEEERTEISVMLGAVIALGASIHLYRRPDIRQWTDEVASEMSKVTWPNKNEVTSSTIIVIVTSAVATLYLALLDRFWGFVTNLVYGS